ncbi:MAG: hypothetical protein FWC70_00910 [Defluviitaleaceae bacterium]|nr:hypothetical protein [Defluviitaleaceae bacterium]
MRHCYGTFAKILLWGITRAKYQRRLHLELLCTLEESYASTKVSDTQASRWFNCRDDVAHQLREAAVSANPKEVSSRFDADIIQPLINPSRIGLLTAAVCETIVNDDNIADDVVIDSINNIKKSDLKAGKEPANIADFLAGAFIYAVRYADNTEGEPFAARINTYKKERVLEPVEPVAEADDSDNSEADNSKTGDFITETDNSKTGDFITETNNSETGGFTAEVDMPDTGTSLPAEANPPRKRRRRFVAAAALSVVLIATFAVLMLFSADDDELSGIIMAASGYRQSLALDSDGALWAWGENNFGQLGDGTVTDREHPVKIMDSVKYVACGMYFSLAICNESYLWAWGNNMFGQLGFDVEGFRNVPRRVEGLQNVQSVSAGWGHVLALTYAGDLWAWGYNSYGQVGDETTQTRGHPIKIMNDVIYVSAGQDHSLAILSDNSLRAWGHNDLGRLGFDSEGVYVSRPTTVPGQFVAVAGGAYHTLAICPDGNLYSWGHNQYGQLGFGDGFTRRTPEQVPGIGNLTAIAAGGNNSMAICSEGNLLSWGRNTYGQADPHNLTHSAVNVPASISESVRSISVGGIHYDTQGRSISVDMLGNLKIWGQGEIIPVIFESSPAHVLELPVQSMMAAGQYHSMKLAQNGDLWTWGGNESGQLGNGTNVGSSEPVKIMENVAFIAAGDFHSVAVTQDGGMWTWGYSGQNIPVRIMDAVTEVSAGGYHSLALDSDGYVWQFNNGVGEKITGSVSQVAAGYMHSMAVDSNGALWIWDDTGPPRPANLPFSVRYVAAGFDSAMIIDTSGYLWAWEHISENSQPIQIFENVRWATVATGNAHTVAITTGGVLWAWGDNEYGQLGSGTTAEYRDRVRVAARVHSVAAGRYHTLMTDTDGNLFAWGLNNHGQTGDGAVVVYCEPVIFDGEMLVNHNRPVTIPEALDGLAVRSASAGESHSFAVTFDGHLYAWGNNAFGQLGNGTRSRLSSNSPVLIKEDIYAVSAGDMHTLALDIHGNLWAWGNNEFGQLGDGTRERRTSPTKIKPDVVFEYIMAWGNVSTAQDEHGYLWVWGGDGYAWTADLYRHEGGRIRLDRFEVNITNANQG